MLNPKMSTAARLKMYVENFASDLSTDGAVPLCMIFIMSNERMSNVMSNVWVI